MSKFWSNLPCLYYQVVGWLQGYKILEIFGKILRKFLKILTKNAYFGDKKPKKAEIPEPIRKNT